MLYKERRWVRLLNLIDSLPQASRLTQAMMDDPEVAEQILDLTDSQTQEEWAPPLSQYGLQEQYLAQIVDGISTLAALVVSVGGGKPDRPKPTPRPRTQLDVIRERRSRETQLEIISLFAPHAIRN